MSAGRCTSTGAHLNALSGSPGPAGFGGASAPQSAQDVFSIPHGAAAPALVPVAVREHLAALPAPFNSAGRGTTGEVHGVVGALGFGLDTPITGPTSRMNGAWVYARRR